MVKFTVRHKDTDIAQCTYCDNNLFMYTNHTMHINGCNGEDKFVTEKTNCN